MTKTAYVLETHGDNCYRSVHQLWMPVHGESLYSIPIQWWALGPVNNAHAQTCGLLIHLHHTARELCKQPVVREPVLYSCCCCLRIAFYLVFNLIQCCMPAPGLLDRTLYAPARTHLHLSTNAQAWTATWLLRPCIQLQFACMSQRTIASVRPSMPCQWRQSRRGMVVTQPS